MVGLIAFLLLAVSTGLVIAVELQRDGVEGGTSALAGAFVGVPVAHSVVRSILFIHLRISRGAPFYLGDLVVITDGPHERKKAEVQRICEGRFGAIVKIIDDPDSTSHYFDWNQIRRIYPVTEDVGNGNSTDK